MDIVEFRTFIFQRQFDSNRSPKETVKIEKEVYEAVMGISLDGDKGEEVITEILNLLFEYCPAVLRLIRLMAKEPAGDKQNPNFSVARRLLVDKC